jgi:hypothetical protein
MLQDPMKLFSDILLSCLGDKLQNKFPEVSLFKSTQSSTVAPCMQKDFLVKKHPWFEDIHCLIVSQEHLSYMRMLSLAQKVQILRNT